MLKECIKIICNTVMVLFGMTLGCSVLGTTVYAEDHGTFTVYVDDQKIEENTLEGLQLDSTTGTLTLSDFSCNGELRIEGSSALTIILEGNNTIQIDAGDNDWHGLVADSRELTVQGNGSLNILGQGSTGTAMLCDSFKMLSGTINIEADNEETFYGITRYTEFNDNASAYEILGGEINIKSDNVTDWNVGIDTQNGDLIIKNAVVNVELGSAKLGFGIVTGVEDLNTYYGGALTVDQATISCKIGYGFNMYFYEMKNCGELMYFVGTTSADQEVLFEEAFSVNQFMKKRYECESPYLTIVSKAKGDELPFDDVSENDWFYNNVKYVFEKNIMTGMTDHQFGPYDSLSRAQFALILYRMEVEPDFDTKKTFHDITGDEWYGKAVLWAAEKGIVTGYENGNFGPADVITREQIAVMMYRYANYKGDKLDNAAALDEFADAKNVSEFAVNAMSWAVGNGVITGKENGTLLDPQNCAARAECAAIIQRFLDK